MNFRSTHSFIPDCPGIPLIWDPDDVSAIFSNYPWTRHGIPDQTLGFQFPTANYNGNELVGFSVRATDCMKCSRDGNACLPCRNVIPKIDHLRKLSKQPPGRLNYQYQTHEQLTQSHRAKNHILTEMRLNVSAIKLRKLNNLRCAYTENEPLSKLCRRQEAP